jgi:hypothetical protein
MPERAIVSLNGTSICLWLVNFFFCMILLYGVALIAGLKKIACSSNFVWHWWLQLKTIRVCGPRYWPQVIDFTPEGKHKLLFCLCGQLAI